MKSFLFVICLGSIFLAPAQNQNVASQEDEIAAVRSLLRAKRPAEAFDRIQKLLASNPQSAPIQTLYGDILLRRAEFAKAEEAYRNATRIDGRYGPAWSGLGRIFQICSMPKTAQFARLKARNLSPNDLDAALDWAGHVLPNREHIRLLEESLVKLPPDSESAKRWRDHIERDKVLGDRIPSELATPYQEYEIPLSQLLYTARRLRGWGLKLIFNDKKPITLLLDTGATGVIVHERAAEQLGLERLGEGRATVHGIGDQESPNSFAALAKTMKVGALTLNNVRVQVAETKRIANEDGLIGSDVFEKFLISLDFPRGKMILQPYPGLTEPPDPAQPYDRKITADRKGFYVFYRFGHIMALPCKLNDVGPAMFVIDTGAAQNLASAEFARELTKVSRDSNSRIKGVSGKVDNVYVAREATIEFAGFRQRNQNVLSIETKRQSDNIGTEIAGFLGMPVLGLLKTTIDYRNGLVRFEYQPH